jgi:hypothetical protein
MVDISYQMVLSTLQTFGILVGIIYYITIMRNAKKNQQLTLIAQEQALDTRQAQLFMHIYSNWYRKDFWENWDKTMEFDYIDFDDAISKLSPEARRSIRSIFAFFEGMGVLVKRGLIEASLIDDLMSAMVVSFWEKWGDFYVEYRVRRNTPMVAEWVEYLYNEIKPIMKEQHPDMKGKVLTERKSK